MHLTNALFRVLLVGAKIEGGAVVDIVAPKHHLACECLEANLVSDSKKRCQMNGEHLWFDVRGGDHVIKAILPSPLEGGLESLDCSLGASPLDRTKEPVGKMSKTRGLSP